MFECQQTFGRVEFFPCKNGVQAFSIILDNKGTFSLVPSRGQTTVSSVLFPHVWGWQIVSTASDCVSWRLMSFAARWRLPHWLQTFSLLYWFSFFGGMNPWVNKSWMCNARVASPTLAHSHPNSISRHSSWNPFKCLVWRISFPLQKRIIRPPFLFCGFWKRFWTNNQRSTLPSQLNGASAPGASDVLNSPKPLKRSPGILKFRATAFVLVLTSHACYKTNGVEPL